MTDIYLNIRKSLLVIHIYQVNLCPYRTQQQRKTGLSCLSRISQFYIFLFSSELSRHSFISKFDSLQDLRFTSGQIVFRHSHDLLKDPAAIVIIEVLGRQSLEWLG